MEPTENTDPKIWRSLNRTKSEIRLLLLRANENISAWPRIALVHKSLEDPLIYEAVSYAWTRGESMVPLFVEIDEGLIDVPITGDLCRILRYLRHKQDDRYLFIDALCISQLDTSEREWQIGLLHKVFRRAKLVNIWICDKWDAHLQEQGIRYLNTLRDAKPEHTTDVSVHEDFLLAINRSRYWKRVWCIGEMALASDVTIHCRSQSIRLVFLKEVLQNILKTWKPRMRVAENIIVSPIGMPCLQWTRMLLRLQSVRPYLTDATIDEKCISLLRVMHIGRKREVSEARDRVNAFTTLYNSLFGQDEVADYTNDTATLYTRFTRRLITQTKSLRILALRTHSPTAARDLPTWVSDWASLYNHDGHYTALVLWEVFCAAANIPGGQSLSVPMLHNGDISCLIVKGVVAGTVSRLGSPWYRPLGDESSWIDITDTLRQVLIDWETLFATITNIELGLHDGSGRTEVLVRTILRNVHLWDETNLDSIEALQMVPPLARRIAKHELNDMLQEVSAQPYDTRNIADALQHHFPGYQKRLYDHVFFTAQGPAAVSPKCHAPTTAPEETKNNTGGTLFLPDAEKSYIGSPSQMSPEAVSQSLPLVSGLQRAAQPAAPANITRTGIGPRYMCQGDLVALLPGANLPFILRPVHQHRNGGQAGSTIVHCRLIGSCYVHGIMDGEFFAHGNHADLITFKII